jgi:hypothetical protein
MRFFRFAPLAALLVLFALPATAQTRVGVGVRVVDLASALGTSVDFEGDLSGVGVSSFVLPIDLSSIRVEPEFGISRTSQTEDFGGDEVTASLTQSLLGLGVFARQAPMDNTYLLYGARVRYSSLSISSDTDGGDFDVSGGIYSIGPFVGGEVELSSRFTLGAEAGLLYNGLTGDLFEGVDGSVINTQTGVFARFFF